MARANEYGLEHKNDAKLRETLFVVTTFHDTWPMKIWWKRKQPNSLIVYGYANWVSKRVVDEFVETLQKAYPDSQDRKLSSQQYGNKIYGMTHVILVIQNITNIKSANKNNTNGSTITQREHWYILLRAKEDVIAEVGLTFLLAGLEDDPVVENTTRYPSFYRQRPRHDPLVSQAILTLSTANIATCWRSCYSIGNKWTKHRR